MAYLPPGWYDLRFPVQGINPAGSAAAASVDQTTYPGTLLFPTTLDAHVAGIAQMPHAWLRGSAIKPHIHWAKTTADAGGLDVAWEFRYSIWEVGATALSATDWGAGTLVVGDLTTAEKHNITSFSEITMTGYKESVVLWWEIRRNVANDTYGENARLLEFDIHYQVNKQGTFSEIPS
jgi:hypothetical protein